MKTNLVMERGKIPTPKVTQKRGSLEDSLKTVRKSNNDFERLKNSL